MARSARRKDCPVRLPARHALRALFLLGCLAILGCSRRERTADVVVYAATPAGIMAAMAAADRGLSVILVEPGRHIGGMVAAGLSATDYWGSAVISGPTREIFQRIGKAYGADDVVWMHEPHVATDVFQEQIDRRRNLRLVTEAPLRGLRMEGPRIAAIDTARGTLRAKVFVDASYEGDLMAASGVAFRTGRESAKEYGEPEAGIRRGKRICAYCRTPVDPLGADGRPLPLVEPADPLPDGSADDRVMNYNFRLCLTRDPANRVPIPAPRRYDPARFAFYSRIAAEMPRAGVTESVKGGDGSYHRKREVRSSYFNMVALPNGKFDLNSGSVFLLEMPGGSRRWPLGNEAERARISEAHREYTLQFFQWMKTDPAVPRKVKDYIAPFGLCADEWKDNGHWPPRLYVREARRMVSDHVMNAQDMKSARSFADSVLVGRSPLDAKSTRLMVAGDRAVKDGAIYRPVPNFEVSYRAIRPKRDEAVNLLVPVAVSASHVAYSAVRMEPILMGLGTAAGEAAALGVEQDVAVQDIDVGTLRRRLSGLGQKLERARAAPAVTRKAASPAAALRPGAKAPPRSASTG